MAQTPAPTHTDLVTQAAAIRSELPALEEAAELAAKALAAKRAELKAAQEPILALGPGRYTDGAATVTVIAGDEGELQPDTFAIPDKHHEEEALTIAGDFRRKLFDRHIYYTCKVGFDGAVQALLTPAKARSLLDLLRIPGKIAGARVVSLRWAK